MEMGLKVSTPRKKVKREFGYNSTAAPLDKHGQTGNKQ